MRDRRSGQHCAEFESMFFCVDGLAYFRLVQIGGLMLWCVVFRVLCVLVLCVVCVRVCASVYIYIYMCIYIYILCVCWRQCACVFDMAMVLGIGESCSFLPARTLDTWRRS